MSLLPVRTRALPWAAPGGLLGRVQGRLLGCLWSRCGDGSGEGPRGVNVMGFDVPLENVTATQRCYQMLRGQVQDFCDLVLIFALVFRTLRVGARLGGIFNVNEARFSKSYL